VNWIAHLFRRRQPPPNLGGVLVPPLPSAVVSRGFSSPSGTHARSVRCSPVISQTGHGRHHRCKTNNGCGHLWSCSHSRLGGRHRLHR